ncbi:pilus assembly protein [Vibrio hannami]|uniref:TadE/TadG family type IV pilus assembly protein n=1 Tax=Vibrio hannami TaxID=2717094 RepID=UPI00240F8DE5|nr:TadE family protein [Vibrio hannami]MDG3087331.1 pilus assembly protein [Vibrio hannami]
MRHMTSHTEQGYAAVEFVITLPILLMLVGIFSELGNLYIQHTTLTKAVQDGARWAVNGVVGTNGGIADSNEIKNLVVYGKMSSGSSSVLESFTTADVSVVEVGNFVTVSASYDYSPIFLNIPYVTQNFNLTLNASSVMRTN